MLSSAVTFYTHAHTSECRPDGSKHTDCGDYQRKHRSALLSAAPTDPLVLRLTLPPSLSLSPSLPPSSADVATDNLLDFDDDNEDSKAMTDSDGSSEEGPLDNKPGRESNNNPSWVT